MTPLEALPSYTAVGTVGARFCAYLAAPEEEEGGGTALGGGPSSSAPRSGRGGTALGGGPTSGTLGRPEAGRWNVRAVDGWRHVTFNGELRCAERPTVS